MRPNFLFACLLNVWTCYSLQGQEKPLPEKMLKIMQQPKYQHAQWGILAKDSETGKVIVDLNSNQLFLAGSVTKVYSVAAFLHAYGDSYRFKTPVYLKGDLQNGILEGDLILVGKGDLTMGARQTGDTLSFTKIDHSYANMLPGAGLTKQNPLHGINELAKQIREKGITQVNGNILVDNRLFEETDSRGIKITPLMINENLIDIVINPTQSNQTAELSWWPQVPGYTVVNHVQTVEKGAFQIQVTSDELGRQVVVEGTIPLDQKEVVRTFSIKDPQHFARQAWIQALHNQGVKIRIDEKKAPELPSQEDYRNMQPVALWISPPLSEYAKLILKVSLNTGANWIPLLLAAQKGKKTFDEGMLLIGQFIEEEAKITRGNFVFTDAAGGENNRLTPQATIKLLDYIYRLPADQFQKFYQALPILGVDGSLADFGKTTEVVGKVYAKTGTGMYENLATQELFLAAQALAGYIMGKNGHLLQFMITINNGQVSEIQDVLATFEDQAQMTAIIYELSN